MTDPCAPQIESFLRGCKLVLVAVVLLGRVGSGHAGPALLSFETSAGPVTPAFLPEVLVYDQAIPATTHAIALEPRPLGAPPNAYQIHLNGAPPRTALPGPTLAMGPSRAVMGVTPQGAVIVWGGGSDAYTPPADANANVVAVALATTHALALKSDGSLLTWGPASDDLAIPTGADSGIVAIAADENASFALAVDGTLTGWGAAGVVPTEAASDVARVTAAHGSRAVVKTDGSVVVWGNVTSPPPAAQSDVLDVALGVDFALALKRNGTVVVWGAAGSPVISQLPALGELHIVAIAAGANHALALTAQDRVIAWGNNSFGQLQIPASATRDVVAIASRGNNAAALLREGSVVTWGYFNSRYPGDGDVWVVPFASDRRLAWPLSAQLPLRSGRNHITLGLVAAPGRAKSNALLAPGSLRNLAVTPDGGVHEALAFADGTAPAPVPALNEIAAVFSGAYGEYALTIRGTPRRLSGASLPLELDSEWFAKIDAIAIGQTHALALTRSGYLTLWGDLPAPPADARVGILAIASGAHHALALRSDGRVIAWGTENSFGELDVPAAARADIIAIAARGHRNLALRADGLVIAWGQIDAAHDLPPPSAQTGVVAIALGAKASLALKADGTVVAWGDEPDAILLPPPSAQTGVVAIAAGDHQKLALLADGSVVAWGATPGGEPALQPAFPALLDAPVRRYHLRIDHRFPAAALDHLASAPGPLTPTFDSDTTAYALAASTHSPTLSLHTLPVSTHGRVSLSGRPHAATGPTLVFRGIGGVAIRPDGSVSTWGEEQPVAPPAAQSDVVALATNDFHVLALKADGTLFTWGDSGHVYGAPPTAKAVAIAANYNYSLALLENGSLVGWGDSSAAPLTHLPADTANLVAIAAGTYHAMALRRNGSVIVWGAGVFQAPHDELSDVVAIAAGGSHNLALRSDGRVVAWGRNTYGQSTVPPAATYGVVAIAAGRDHSLALKADGSVITWGGDPWWQTAVPAAARSGVVAIVASPFGCAAVRADGTVVRWGGVPLIPDELQGQFALPASAPLPLELGANSIAVALTARDDSTTRTYTLAVNRVAAPALALTAGVGTTEAFWLSDGAERYDLGVRRVGAVSTPQTFTVLNSGTADLVLSAADLTGNHAAEFEVGGLVLPATLAPGASTTFDVTVAPGALGSRWATLRLHANLPHGGPHHLPLLATGITIASELAAWRSIRFTHTELTNPALEATVWGNLADPDADGLPNLLEYALQTAPKTATASPLVTGLDTTEPGSPQLTLTYKRVKRALLAGLLYEVEWSDTLAADSWSVSGVSERVVGSTSTAETIVASVPAGSERRFLRLRVIAP